MPTNPLSITRVYIPFKSVEEMEALEKVLSKKRIYPSEAAVLRKNIKENTVKPFIIRQVDILHIDLIRKFIREYKIKDCTTIPKIVRIIRELPVVDLLDKDKLQHEDIHIPRDSETIFDVSFQLRTKAEIHKLAGFLSHEGIDPTAEVFVLENLDEKRLNVIFPEVTYKQIDDVAKFAKKEKLTNTTTLVKIVSEGSGDIISIK